MTQLNRAIWALSATLIISWGAVYYAFALTGPLLARELNWPAPFLYSGFSMMLLIAGLCSPWIGRAIDRRGGRAVMAIGSLVSALGLALLGLARGEIGFLIACAVCGVGMAMTFYDAAFASLTWLSAGRARRAITLVTLAGGLASTVFWPLTQWLLAYLDWRQVCFVYAALHALFSAPLLALALPRQPQEEPASDIGGATAQAPGNPPLTGPPRWRAFALFAVVLIASGVVTNGIAVHLLPALGAMGATPAAALLVGSLIGPSQVAGRLVDLFFGRLINPMALGVGAIALAPLSFALLLLAPFSAVSLIAYAVMYGIGNGLMTIARGIVPLALFGREGYGAMIGLLAAPVLVAQAASPAALAIVSSTYGPRALFAACAALTLIAFIAMTTLAWRFGRRALA